MIDPTRTAFASPEPERRGQLLAFPAERSLGAIQRRAADLAAEEVRVEYRGRVKVYAGPAALQADLAQAPQVLALRQGRRSDRLGWLLVAALVAAPFLIRAL